MSAKSRDKQLIHKEGITVKCHQLLILINFFHISEPTIKLSLPIFIVSHRGHVYGSSKQFICYMLLRFVQFICTFFIKY